MDKMIDKCSTLNIQGKLNSQILKIMSENQGLNPDYFRGIEINRYFFPYQIKINYCNRPERNSRLFDNNNSNQEL